jgi:hypothetical protein
VCPRIIELKVSAISHEGADRTGALALD